MRRNRVLILFAVVFAVSTAVFWLGTVLAAVAIDVNNELTVNAGDSGIIDDSLLLASDPDDPDSPNEIITYTLITVPANGDLVISDTGGITTLMPISQFHQTDINANSLVYNHTSIGAEIADTFDFTVTSSIDEITDTFSIKINQPPTINNDTFTVQENEPINTLVGAVVTSDANTADSFTYTILTSEPSTAFAINSINGDITTTSVFDFETFGDTPHFTLTVQIEDSGLLTDTATININVSNINEAPTVDPATFSVAENSANGTNVGTPVTASDPEDDSLTFDIVGGDPDNVFDIGATSGQITVADNSFLDFEAQGATPHFSLTVEVSDTEFTDTATVEINLTDVNEAPTVDPATFSVAENSANGTNVGTPVTASDPEDDSLMFDIVGGDPDNVFDIGTTSGQITVADNSFLDFEAQGATPHFSLTVEVDDGSLIDTATIEINLTDVNEAPTVNDDTFTVPEDSSNGAPVGTVTASDPEDNSLAFDIVGGDPDNVFDIGPSSGQITVADNSFFDYETQGATPHFSLTVEVNDGSLTDTATIVINVTDVNEPPTVNDNLFSINENSSNSTVVGTVTATDPDFSDVLTFGILSGNTGGAFAIANDGSNNGRITVANSSQLDYEIRQSFMLGIIVTDTGGLNNTANVTININNLFDEAPTVNNATFSVSEDSNNGVVVGTVTATDPEFASGDELTFSIIGGNTGTVFAINSSSGQITVPDASKLDADAMPTFNLTVQATDRGGKIDTGTITINVSPLPITFIYLPIMLNNYPPVEPNNNCAQSYGIGPATDYEFTADDVEDWYTITLTSSANLSIILSSFEPAQGQLIVYGGSCGNLTLLGNNGNPNTTEKTLHLGIRPAGTYYIRVYSEPVTNTNYTLRVNIN